ncbi:MAG: hypothetical protein ACR2IF_09185 [Terriglobales bacterium]
MDADFSVELGAEDPTLAIPWWSEDGCLRYYDLKSQPDLLLYIEEANHNQELAEFLTQVNSVSSRLASAKCDTWFTTELNEEEAIYGAACKFGSYVDLVFADEAARFSFELHEDFARRLTKLLARAPQISAAAELIIRRCYYGIGNDAREGFYLSFYLFGYGDEEAEASKRWGIGLKLVGNAILQLSAQSTAKADVSAE